MGDWKLEWDDYTLKQLGVHLSADDDRLIWSYILATAKLSAQLAHDFLVDELLISADGWWRKELWRWKILLKIKCFNRLCVNVKRG